MGILTFVLIAAVIAAGALVPIIFTARRKARQGKRPGGGAADWSGEDGWEKTSPPPGEGPHRDSVSRSETAHSAVEGKNDLIIQDILDVNILQQVIDVFVRATGLASVVVDINGAPLTSMDNFTDFCMKHTRGTEEGSRRCQANDAKGGEEATKTGRPVIYYCHAGLVDFAVPIIVAGKQIGTWLGGQVLPAKPDERKYRKIAKEIGADVNEYLKDLRKIKIIPKEQIDGMADLLSLIANTLLQIGFARKVTEEKAAELSDMVMLTINRLLSGIREISEPAKLLESMMKQVTAAMQETSVRADRGQEELTHTVAKMQAMEEVSRIISDKLQEINEKSHDISGIMGTIIKVADQTNLLSLNAAIEAESAGEHGRGFSVVAHEIRRLADQTAVSTLDIERTIQAMHAAVSVGVKETDKFITEVRRSANDVVKIGSQLKGIIEQVGVLLPRFEEVGSAVDSQTERTNQLHQSMTGLRMEMHRAIESMRQSFSGIEEPKVQTSEPSDSQEPKTEIPR